MKRLTLCLVLAGSGCANEPAPPDGTPGAGFDEGPSPPPEPTHALDSASILLNSTVGGTRLLAATLIPKDGGPPTDRWAGTVPLFYDRTLGIWCGWSEVAESAYRCLPQGHAAIERYVDATCTEPALAYVFTGSRYVRHSTGSNACTGDVPRVYERATTTARAEWTYAIAADGTCQPTGERETVQSGFVEVPLSTFTAGTVRDVEVMPGLAARRVEGEDGSGSFVGFIDTRYGFTCAQNGTCSPPHDAYPKDLFVDSLCEEPALHSYQPGAFSETCGPTGYNGALVEALPIAAPVFNRNPAGVCEPATVDRAAVPLWRRSSEPYVPLEFPARIAVPVATMPDLEMSITQFGAHRAFNYWTSSTSYCEVAHMVDGTWRCRTSVPFGEFRFSDPVCSTTAVITNDSFATAVVVRTSTGNGELTAYYNVSDPAVGRMYGWVGDLCRPQGVATFFRTYTEAPTAHWPEFVPL